MKRPIATRRRGALMVIGPRVRGNNQWDEMPHGRSGLGIVRL
jgi:hypothetical protein